jgi:hypothetical protein
MQARLLTVPWTSAAEEEQAQSWACFFHGTRGHKTSVQQEHKSLQETFRQSSLRKILQTFVNKCNPEDKISDNIGKCSMPSAKKKKSMYLGAQCHAMCT